MGNVFGALADRFDGHGPVIQNPIENLAVIGVCTLRPTPPPPNTPSEDARLHPVPLSGLASLSSTVWVVNKLSGVSLRDKDGDGVLDMQ